MLTRSFLERYYFERFILDVCIATLEDGGVTSNVHTYQFLAPIDAWGLPRYPERTRILPPGADLSSGLRDFIQTNTDYLHAPCSWLGTWINPSTRCCHLDITEICTTFEEAHAQALHHNATSARAIVALYNFKQKRTVYVQDNRVEGAPGAACADRIRCLCGDVPQGQGGGWEERAKLVDVPAGGAERHFAPCVLLPPGRQ